MQKYEAKTVEEAVKQAASAKGVTVEELTYYVIEEKAGKIFGIGAKAVIEAYCMTDIQHFIYDYLETFFKGIGLETEIGVSLGENNNFEVNISSENNAILIGKNGQTLQAITTVLKAAANAEFKRRVNIMVDVNGYKEERTEKLKQMCDRIAKTVVKTKVSARLGALSSEERREVHQYLANYPHVRTESEGEGQNRRLKIIYDSEKA